MTQRYSLGFLLCATAFIALGISHAITSCNLKSAKSEIAWLKNARNTSWPDPNSISIVSLDSPAARFRPKSKFGHWHWKMMSPVSLRLRWDASPKTLDVPPATVDPDSINFINLPTGTSDLDVSIRERADGKLWLNCNLNGKVHEFEFDEDSTLFSQHGFFSRIAGVRETEFGDPALPFLLLCVRGYAATSVPSEGIRLWIEPTPE